MVLDPRPPERRFSFSKIRTSANHMWVSRQAPQQTLYTLKSQSAPRLGGIPMTLSQRLAPIQG